jgi:hypothetical protein
MDHWTMTLMGRVITVDYERLVENTEEEIRRMIASCGLSWSDRCLRFYENPNIAKTLSAEQVKSPIFRTSVGRWKNYREHLGPLEHALAH